MSNKDNNKETEIFVSTKIVRSQKLLREFRAKYNIGIKDGMIAIETWQNVRTKQLIEKIVKVEKGRLIDYILKEY